MGDAVKRQPDPRGERELTELSGLLPLVVRTVEVDPEEADPRRCPPGRTDHQPSPSGVTSASTLRRARPIRAALSRTRHDSTVQAAAGHRRKEQFHRGAKCLPKAGRHELVAA
jgi:hypothetical protein